jgi:carboxypeptidase family protein
VTTPQGPRTFTTDSDGAFFAPFLTPGMYGVKVELQGFRTLDRQNVEVRLGQRVELHLPLQVGPLTESVNVSGAAPLVARSPTSVPTPSRARTTRSRP